MQLCVWVCVCASMVSFCCCFPILYFLLVSFFFSLFPCMESSLLLASVWLLDYSLRISEIKTTFFVTFGQCSIREGEKMPEKIKKRRTKDPKIANTERDGRRTKRKRNNHIGLSPMDWIFLPFAELLRSATVKCTMYNVQDTSENNNEKRYTAIGSQMEMGATNFDKNLFEIWYFFYLLGLCLLFYLKY